MRIIKIQEENPSEKAIKEAVKVLEQGGVIVYPTETAYALGCDVFNQKARAKIFKIKKRPKEKKLPLIAGSLRMVRQFCEIDSVSQKLIKKYWPGPLTLVLPLKKEVAKKLKLKREEGLAIRVSSGKIARLLSLRLGRPIVSTSANLSGRPACYSVNCFLDQCEPSLINLVLDAGRLPFLKVSTIVKVKKERIEILREGAIKIKV
jgi:L-threonylcarbamoyladenylate synthase